MAKAQRKTQKRMEKRTNGKPAVSGKYAGGYHMPGSQNRNK